ncbi:hypothetical protein LUZ60_003846 [Juncus effusus]|nr:hypothetical protein LUZ60_003846 [Juncus effusus]
MASVGEPDLSLSLTWGSKKLNCSPSEPDLSVPSELTLRIVSFLDAYDVFSLGSCSKTLNEICDSACVWKELYMKRWPDHQYDISHTEPQKEILCPWKTWYITMHKEMSAAIFSHFRHVEEQLEEYGFLEIIVYKEAIDILRDLKVGFGDIRLMFLRRKLHAVLNLIGLHYSFFYLQVSAGDLRNTLAFYQVLDRELIVEWILVPSFCYCDFTHQERYSLVLSLAEITDGEEAILYFLESGLSAEMRSISIASYSLSQAQKSNSIGKRRSIFESEIGHIEKL